MSYLQCPQCRSTALATVERLSGISHCHIVDGVIVWEGETTVDLAQSVPERHPKLGTLIHCRNCGNEWFPRSLRSNSDKRTKSESKNTQLVTA